MDPEWAKLPEVNQKSFLYLQVMTKKPWIIKVSETKWNSQNTLLQSPPEGKASQVLAAKGNEEFKQNQPLPLAVLLDTFLFVLSRTRKKKKKYNVRESIKEKLIWSWKAKKKGKTYLTHSSITSPSPTMRGPASSAGLFRSSSKASASANCRLSFSSALRETNPEKKRKKKKNSFFERFLNDEMATVWQNSRSEIARKHHFSNSWFYLQG